MMSAGLLIKVLLLVLCTLAALDLWRQVTLKGQHSWFINYINAVKSSNDFWRLGYRLEELDYRIENQKSFWKAIEHQIQTALSPKFKIDRNTLRQNTHNIHYTRQSRIALHNLIRNDSAVHQIRCGAEDGPLLRIGVNDFRTDDRDSCQVFTSTAKVPIGPLGMFDLVEIESAAAVAAVATTASVEVTMPIDGVVQTGAAFALRSVANGRFLKVVPPPADNEMAPWKVVVGGTLIGAAETFRMSSNGKLYSPLMGGYFACGFGRMVSGFAGMYSSNDVFYLEKVHSSSVQDAYLQLDLSQRIQQIQTAYSASHDMNSKQIKESTQQVVGMDNPNAVKICLGVPMTSKGTVMSDVIDSPFWTNLFDSFMKSVDWRSNRFIYRFYLGFDKADSLYDTGDAWSDLREEFRHRATYRMLEQLMDEQSINAVLTEQLSIKLMHFDHLEGAPSQVVSQLMLSAYTDGFDYFYQVNDDTVIISPNWAPKLVSSLASNPKIPNFGVTGPTDTNNEKIFTHSFVHRTHLEIFGHLFPTYFKNWWSDDWITTVYGSEHTFRTADVLIEHNVNAQKSNGFTRYTVDQTAQLQLDAELRKGHVQVDQWLKKNNLPRLPLPVICGYIPLVRYLENALKTSSSVISLK